MKKVLFPILALVLALGLALAPAMPATATTGAIWTIGAFDDSRAEFNHTDFDGVHEATYDVATDTASDFPAFLYISGYSGSWQEEGVHKVTINFSLTMDYRDVTLKYKKAGGETDEVSLDGGTPQTVSGPGENIFDTYELSLGNLSSGTHHIVIECVDKGTGEGAHTYDALELSGLAGTDLVAGGGNPKSAMDVGNVDVWNDGDYLYVQYVTSGGWCLTETHLHVATSMEAIPQRNGNPVPGQFDYKAEHDCITQYPYTIPLNWDPCTNVYIAAHAVVQKVITEAPYYASTVVDSEQGKTKGGGDVRWQRSDPEQGLAFESEQDEFNFFSLGFGGWIVVQFDCPIRNGDGDDVQIIEDTWGTGYPLETANVSASQDGTNWTLLGEADNTNQDGIHTTSEFDLGALSWAKYIKVVDTTDPALHNSSAADGLDVNAIVSLQDCIQEETAWGDGLDFPGKNWATYFMYHVQ